MDIIGILTFIAATASVIGAIFATWRWNYARKGFKLQEQQLYLQILMLAESREYWKMPKRSYVKSKSKYKENVNEEIEHIIKELKSTD